MSSFLSRLGSLLNYIRCCVSLSASLVRSSCAKRAAGAHRWVWETCGSSEPPKPGDRGCGWDVDSWRGTFWLVQWQVYSWTSNHHLALGGCHVFYVIWTLLCRIWGPGYHALVLRIHSYAHDGSTLCLCHWLELHTSLSYGWEMGQQMVWGLRLETMLEDWVHLIHEHFILGLVGGKLDNRVRKTPQCSQLNSVLCP